MKKEYIVSLIQENKRLEAVSFLHKNKDMSLLEAKNYTDRLILKKNIYLLDKRMQEIEKIELSDKFEIKSLRIK